MPEEKLFTKEAAEFLGISLRLLHRYLYELPVERRLKPDGRRLGLLLFKKKTLINFVRWGPGRPPQKGNTNESKSTRLITNEAPGRDG